MTIMRFLISSILLVAFLPLLSVTASENSVCNVRRLIRIRDAESNRAMQWSSGIFSGHCTQCRDLWVAERRRTDYYWRLRSDERARDDETKLYGLQAPDYAFRKGMLRMERCNDDTEAQAWSFERKNGEEQKDEYRIKNFDLEACLIVRADGSYSFVNCGEASFTVDDVNMV